MLAQNTIRPETVAAARGPVLRRRAGRRREPWSRRKRIAVVTLIVLGLLAMAGVAWALFLAHAPVKGSVNSKAFQPVFAAPASGTATDMTCTTSVDASGALVLTIDNAYPGGKCDVAAKAHIGATSGEPGVVTGIDLPGLPAGWTAAVNASTCGLTLPNDGTDWDVYFTVTMTTSAAAGSGGTFSPGTAGLQVVPKSQAPTTVTCSTYNGA